MYRILGNQIKNETFEFWLFEQNKLKSADRLNIVFPGLIGVSSGLLYAMVEAVDPATGE